MIIKYFTCILVTMFVNIIKHNDLKVLIGFNWI